MHDSKIKISIIFPSFNGENLIYNCLESIQNLDNINEIELIVVDNDSTDSTKEIVKSFNKFDLHLIEKSERGLSLTLKGFDFKKRIEKSD